MEKNEKTNGEVGGGGDAFSSDGTSEDEKPNVDAGNGAIQDERSDIDAENGVAKGDDVKETAEHEEKAAKDAATVQTRVKRIGLAALILSMGIFCSRLLGYVREAVIAYQAGAGAATDTYNAAFLLPDMMNHFLAGGTLSITFIPLFAGYLAKNEPQKAERLFSLIATTMGSLLCVAVVICWIFATPIVGLLFQNFSPEQIEQTVEMTRIVLPGQVFHYLGGLMMAVLMAKGRFVPSAMAPLVYNLGIIGFGVLLGDAMGMKGFAIGALCGAFLGPFLIPLIALRKEIHYRPVFGFRDADFKKYILLTLPLLLGVSLTTVDEWLGKIIGSSLGTGTISWLNYARKLVLVPIAIVGQAAGQAALPYLSQLSARGEFDKAAETLHKTLKSVVVLSMVMIGFFVVLAEPMVSLVYERGAFTAVDTEKTAMILRILAISIVFWTIQMVSVRAFYATQNTLTPMVITTVVTGLSIPVYWVLSQQYGLVGLAMASCIGMALQATSIVVFYRRKNVHFMPQKIIRFMAIGLVLGVVAGGGSAIGMALCGFLTIPSHGLEVFVQLCVAGCLGLIPTCLVARFALPEEFRAFVGKIRRKILRR